MKSLRSVLGATVSLLLAGAIVATGGPVAAGAPAAGDPPRTQYHEFQANCEVSHRAMDDPIVAFGRPGASHDHTFIGNKSTNAFSTLASLELAGTTCTDTADKSAYWIPTLFDHGVAVRPTTVIVYYKSGVIDYRTVRPFPRGMQLLFGDAMNQDPARSTTSWSCGRSTSRVLPTSCPPGTKLIARLIAPSCWDGRHLRADDHRSHVVYPLSGRCPATHPVAIPMLEYKVPYPVRGDHLQLRLASGGGPSFHADFVAAWQPGRQRRLVTHCINQGRQCDAKGFDQFKP